MSTVMPWLKSVLHVASTLVYFIEQCVCSCNLTKMVLLKKIQYFHCWTSMPTELKVKGGVCDWGSLLLLLVQSSSSSWYPHYYLIMKNSTLYIIVITQAPKRHWSQPDLYVLCTFLSLVIGFWRLQCFYLCFISFLFYLMFCVFFAL